MPNETTHPEPDAFTRALAKLQTRLVDVLRGYDEMEAKAEPEIIGIVRDFARVHRDHEAQLARRLGALGGEPDDDGSFFGLIQETVVRGRAILTDLDTNVLPAVIRGEESVRDLTVDTADAAEDESDRTLLTGQAEALGVLIERAQAQAG